MKFFKHLLFAFTIVFFITSCSKDDENPNSNQNSSSNSIIGKWYVYSTEENGKITIHKYEKCSKTYIEFSDSKIKTVSFNPLDNCKERVYIVSYTIKGDKITTTHEDGKIVVVTYRINGDELIVLEKGEKSVYKRL